MERWSSAHHEALGVLVCAGVARSRGESLAYLRWCGATRATRLPVRSWRLMANLRAVVDIARANAVRVMLDP